MPSLKCTIPFPHCTCHPSDAWKPSIFSLLTNSRAFPLSRVHWPVHFYNAKLVTTSLFNTLLCASYFLGSTVLVTRSLLYDWNTFSLFFFKVERVLLVTTKSKASSLRGAPFSRNLYLILEKLYQRWCFAAEVVAMFDFWCEFLLNEIRHGWRNKDIRFGVQCSIWHYIWLRPWIYDFTSTVILAILSYCSN